MAAWRDEKRGASLCAVRNMRQISFYGTLRTLVLYALYACGAAWMCKHTCVYLGCGFFTIYMYVCVPI